MFVWLFYQFLTDSRDPVNDISPRYFTFLYCRSTSVAIVKDMAKSVSNHKNVKCILTMSVFFGGVLCVINIIGRLDGLALKEIIALPDIL